MMPSGSPKLRPQPEWIIGTIASTIIAFCPKRPRTSVIEAVTLIPANGAMMKSATRKSVIIRRGSPKPLSISIALSIT